MGLNHIEEAGGTANLVPDNAHKGDTLPKEDNNWTARRELSEQAKAAGVIELTTLADVEEMIAHGTYFAVWDSAANRWSIHRCYHNGNKLMIQSVYRSVATQKDKYFHALNPGSGSIVRDGWSAMIRQGLAVLPAPTGTAVEQVGHGHWAYLTMNAPRGYDVVRASTLRTGESCFLMNENICRRAIVKFKNNRDLELEGGMLLQSVSWVLVASDSDTASRNKQHQAGVTEVEQADGPTN